MAEGFDAHDVEDHRDEEAGQEDPLGRLGREDREDGASDAVARRHGEDQPTILEADEQDEQPDADADRALQRNRHGVHDRLAQTDEHGDRHEDALDHDHAHRSGRREPLAGECERHDCVDAQPGRQRERIVADDPHRDGCHAGDECRAGRDGGQRPDVALAEARSEDRAVHEEDVGHDHEGGQAGARLGC